MRDKSHRPRRVLIVGTDRTAHQLAEELKRSGTQTYEVVGFVDETFSAVPGEGVFLGRRDEILRIVDEYDVDEVIVSDPLNWQERFLQEMVSNGHRNLQVKVVPNVYEAMLGVLPLNTVDDIPLVALGRQRRRGIYTVLKPWLERIVAFAGLAVTSPILLPSMLLVKLASKGPAIYRQERVGRGGKTFTLYKIRTMVDGAEAETGPKMSSETDSRVTRIGRLLRATKIDELPQLFNVLKGNMSLVGPRPERPCFVEQFESRIACYKERHRVRPGITGLAQVYGDYSTSPETKLRYDLMYVYNHSLWLDIKIILLTAGAVRRELLPLAFLDNRRVTRTAEWES